MMTILWRALVVTHRYLGVAVGVLMLGWFLSGIVMMYVAYPELSEKERVLALPPIAWQACCAFDALKFAGDQPVLNAELEKAAGVPVLVVRPEGQPPIAENVSGDGSPLAMNAAMARASALAVAARIAGPGAHVTAMQMIARDQWTVGGDYARHRPLYRFDFNDPAATILYVSGTTGQAVLWTTGWQRFWNWLGAVPHWLYFTELRAQGRLWSQVVIWTSILGGFLTLIGLYLGIAQFKRRKSGRMSPYRGWFYWHHMIGLAFGIVTLAWVVSGTLSLNPWGLLESGRGAERTRLQGAPPGWDAVRQSLAALKAAAASDAIVHLTSAPLNGVLFWLATDERGRVTRLDAKGAQAPVAMADLAKAASRLAGGTEIASQELIRAEDAYYFGAPGHGGVSLPVYRVIMKNPDRTRYYLDPATAGLMRKADGATRGYRWLFDGLHRWDFAAWLRVRPLWDAVMLFLLLGCTAGMITGVYLALWRIRRDVRFK
jgi:hypothetical protein